MSGQNPGVDDDTPNSVRRLLDFYAQHWPEKLDAMAVNLEVDGEASEEAKDRLRRRIAVARGFAAAVERYRRAFRLWPDGELRAWLRRAQVSQHVHGPAMVAARRALLEVIDERAKRN